MIKPPSASFFYLPLGLLAVLWYWWEWRLNFDRLPLLTGTIIIAINYLTSLIIFYFHPKAATILLINNYVIILLTLAILRTFYL